MYKGNSHTQKCSIVVPSDLLDAIDESEFMAPNHRGSRRNGRVVFRDIARLCSSQAGSCGQEGYARLEVMAALVLIGLSAVAMLAHGVDLSGLISSLLRGVAGGHQAGASAAFAWPLGRRHLGLRAMGGHLHRGVLSSHLHHTGHGMVEEKAPSIIANATSLTHHVAVLVSTHLHAVMLMGGSSILACVIGSLATRGLVHNEDHKYRTAGDNGITPFLFAIGAFIGLAALGAFAGLDGMLPRLMQSLISSSTPGTPSGGVL